MFLKQTELDSPFSAGPFNEEDLLRRPYQRTSARALGKRGLKDGLDKEIILSIGGGNIYLLLINVQILLEKGYIIVNPT